MKLKLSPLLQFLFFFIISTSTAQHKVNSNKLQQTLNSIDTAFQQNDTVNFNRIFPIESVQSIYKNAVEKNFKKQAGPHQLLKIFQDSAFVLISGTAIFGNSGDETSFSTNYSGIYKLKKTAGVWKVIEKIAIDRENQIKKQNLSINLKPGIGITVSDTLRLNVKDYLGFAVKLNHRAVLSSVLLNDKNVKYLFSGGILWINAKSKQQHSLIINYAINVEKDEENRNSAYFGDIFGHLRNQYYWHPFFSYSSPNDRADFTLHCAIPATYGLATSLPQKEYIKGDSKITEARSDNPTFALSLYYDKNWETKTLKKDQVELVIYATKDFEPSIEKLQASFSTVYDTLQHHFGKPLGNYFGIVQDRSSGGNGWKNRSNSIIIAAEKGSYLITDKPSPRAVFGHEIAHQWTNPQGEATNFLTEGWATYAESILLQNQYGDTIVPVFFKSQRLNYLNGKFDGKYSLAQDYGNSGVSYSKGSWLFYMLAQQLGKEKVAQVMVNFSNSGDQSIKSFIHQLSKIAGKNMEPIMNPWLNSKVIPVLSASKAGNTLSIKQESDLFIFPLTIRFKLSNGDSIDKTININGPEQTVNLDQGQIAVSYILDPDNQLLLTVKQP